jgi:hypothetical protein
MADKAPDLTVTHETFTRHFYYTLTESWNIPASKTGIVQGHDHGQVWLDGEG